MRSNTGFNNCFKSSHEYGIVETVATEGWRFLDWEGTNRLLLSDKGTELGLKLDILFNCDFTQA